MNAIISGGTGFLGYALVREFLRNGDNVTAIVRPVSKRLERLERLSGINIVEANFDSSEIRLPICNYDVFYHLAWEGARNDHTAQYTNIRTTLDCLQLAAEYGCKRFVCTGSQAEYGETEEPITEQTLINPATSYGSAKAAAYYLSRDLAKQLGISHTWVRVFSVYGENDNSNTLFAQMMKMFPVSNEFFFNTDGNHIWNYLYETDAARALRLIGICDSAIGVFNLASKTSRPLHEYAEIMKNIVNPSLKLRYGTEKSSVSLNTASEKLRNMIGEYEELDFQLAVERSLKWPK